jgi:hypothetical protein
MPQQHQSKASIITIKLRSLPPHQWSQFNISIQMMTVAQTKRNHLPQLVSRHMEMQIKRKTPRPSLLFLLGIFMFVL